VSAGEGVDEDRGVGTDAGVPADEVGFDTGKEEAALPSSKDFSSSSEEEHVTAVETPRTDQE